MRSCIPSVFRPVLPLVVSCEFLAAPCASQIVGRVFDPLFRVPVPGATVSIEGLQFSATTDANGRFSLRYAPGLVGIVAQKSGYQRINAEIALELSTYSRVPLRDLTLVRLPPERGVYAVVGNAYVRLEASGIDTSSNGLALGVPAQAVLTTLHRQQAPILIADYGGSLLRGSFMGVSGFAIYRIPTTGNVFAWQNSEGQLETDEVVTGSPGISFGSGLDAVMSGQTQFFTFNFRLDQDGRYALCSKATLGGPAPPCYIILCTSGGAANIRVGPTDLRQWRVFFQDQSRAVSVMPPPIADWRELLSLQSWGRYDTYDEIYLLAVNRRNLAADALASAYEFLNRGDLANVERYANRYTKLYYQSNELFTAASQLNANVVSSTGDLLAGIYAALSEAVQGGSRLACGPSCAELVDFVSLATDYAVDFSTKGASEAQRRLIAKSLTRTILESNGLSTFREHRATHFIGGSGLYNVLGQVTSDVAFKAAFMKVLANTGANAVNRLAEDRATAILQSLVGYFRRASILEPTPSSSEASPDE